MDVTEYFKDPQAVATDGFSPTVIALLTYADAEDYVPIFKDQNIGIKDLSELTDTDLIILGVDVVEIRESILRAINQLPESTQYFKTQESSDFGAEDFTNVLDDYTKHIERIFTSILSTKILLKRNNPADFIICPPKMYATELILKSVHEMEKTLDKMKTELLDLKKIATSTKGSKFKRKKVIVGVLGSFVVAGLSYSLFKSLQDIL